MKALAQDETVVLRAKDKDQPHPAVGRLPDARFPQGGGRRAHGPGQGLLPGADRTPPPIGEDWIGRQYEHLDRTDGEIDTLATRLASVRTLAYVANRPDWLADPAEWQGKTRQLEDRLSDTLHEKLISPASSTAGPAP